MPFEVNPTFLPCFEILWHIEAVSPVPPVQQRLKPKMLLLSLQPIQV